MAVRLISKQQGQWLKQEGEREQRELGVAWAMYSQSLLLVTDFLQQGPIS